MKNKKIILLLIALIIPFVTSVIRGFPLKFLEPAVCIQIIGANCPPFVFNWPNLLMDFIFWITILIAVFTSGKYIQKLKKN